MEIASFYPSWPRCMMSRKNAKPLFSKRCSCENHEIFTNNETIEFSIRSRSFFCRRKEFTELLQRHLIKETAASICTVCLAYARRKIDERDAVESSNTEMVVDKELEICEGVGNRPLGNDNISLATIKSLIQQIRILKWSDIEDNSLKISLCDLSESLGRLIREDLENEKEKMSDSCKSFENLSQLNYRNWYQQRNKLLTSFIFGCTGVNETHESPKKFNAAIHSVEQIIYTKNINIVTPFSFMRNILMYTVSKSKMACNVLGVSEGSGCYTKVNSLLNKESIPLEIQDESNIVITFDNEQKVGKHSGRIREKSKQPLSIITTVGVIETKPEEKTQFDAVYRQPTNYAESMVRINDLEKVYRDIMGNYRSQFLAEMISAVVEEQKFDAQGTDYVDKTLHFNNTFICPVCHHVDNNFFETCSSCAFNTSFYDHGYDKYFRTPAQHIGVPVINNAEPVLVNPASIENVKTVLESIETDVFTKEKRRKWVTVMCDGVPYDFASTLQDRYKVCGICSNYIDNELLTEHSKFHAVKEDAIAEFTLPFERIFLRPGPGHIELNMGRVLLSFLWEPFMKSFAQELGFRTPNALKVFKNGIDHHRTCQVLESCLIGFTKELLVPFVRSCHISKELPTAKGYFSWYNASVTSQKYGFFFHVTFWYLLAFIVYKEGVRKNNSDVMMAARTTFAPLFYIGHHPKYRRLLVRDLVERVNYSDSVANFTKSTESHSVSGRVNGGQGGDFIHEEINKNIKSLLPGIGMPTQNIWVNIIRKAATINELKKIIFQEGSLNDKGGKKRPKKFEHEITIVRKMIRREHYLSNFEEEERMTTISGEVLDIALCDFSYLAKENYKLYKEGLVKTGDYCNTKLIPVFVTSEQRIEFDKIENKTIAEIKSKIEHLCSLMKEKDTALILTQKLKRKTNLKKHEYISMYYEAKKQVDFQDAERLSDELHGNENVNVNIDEDEIL